MTTLEAVQRAARGAGPALEVDFRARSAATVGGMLATAAGGAQALRHGTMRARRTTAAPPCGPTAALDPSGILDPGVML
jgi:hypothetical protein